MSDVAEHKKVELQGFQWVQDLKAESGNPTKMEGACYQGAWYHEFEVEVSKSRIF